MEFLASIHPVVVHFPIAFFVLYFLLETIGTLFKKDFFTKTALFVLSLGVFFSLIAVLTGNQAHETFKYLNNSYDYANQLIERHEELATLSLWYFTILLFIRVFLIIKKKFTSIPRYLFILFALIGCVLILLTGYYGGVLVFEHGIGTKLFR